MKTNKCCVEYLSSCIPLQVTTDYSADQYVGSISVICPCCKALKYRNKTFGLCWTSSKVKLVSLDPLPEPFCSLVFVTRTDSTHLLTKIKKYNSCFQMTLFGAINVVWDNFKYIYKEVTKKSDMAVFGVGADNFTDEVIQYQMDRTFAVRYNIMHFYLVETQLFSNIKQLTKSLWLSNKYKINNF